MITRNRVYCSQGGECTLQAELRRRFVKLVTVVIDELINRLNDGRTDYHEINRLSKKFMGLSFVNFELLGSLNRRDKREAIKEAIHKISGDPKTETFFCVLQLYKTCFNTSSEVEKMYFETYKPSIAKGM